MLSIRCKSPEIEKISERTTKIKPFISIGRDKLSSRKR